LQKSHESYNYSNYQQVPEYLFEIAIFSKKGGVNKNKEKIFYIIKNSMPCYKDRVIVYYS
jgi:hypothetical protein